MENSDNNLEQFFNKKFAHNVGAEPWNTPPDDVWAAVEKDILQRKTQRKRIGILLPLFFLALAASVGGHLYRVKSFELKVKELEEQLKACESKDNAQPAQPDKTNGAEALITTSKAPDPTIANHDANRSHARPDRMRTQLGRGVQGTDKGLSSPLAQAGPNTQNGPIQQVASERKSTVPEASIESTAFNKTHNQIGFLPERPMRPFSASRRAKLIFLKNPETGLKSNRPQSLWRIGPMTEGLVWKDWTRGKLDAPLSELLVNESVANSLSYGLTVRRAISRHWLFETGLLYGSRQSTSTYKLKVPYTISTEHSNPDGSIDNSFTHSLPYGLGNVNTFLVLNRSANSQVADKEEINLDFAFRSEVQALFCPVKLVYCPQSTMKGPIFAVGLNQEFDIGSRLKVANAKSNHSLVHEKSVSISKGNRQQRNYNLQGTVNVGYQVPVGQYFSGTLTAGYNRALMNKFQSTGYAHKIDCWSIGFSATRNF